MRFSWRRSDDSVQNKISRLEETISDLQNKLSILEGTTSLHNSAADIQQKVNSALRELGEKIKDGQPNYSYFNIRFRSIETALANIRELGNLLGERLRKERLNGRKAERPAPKTIKSKLCTQADIESDWAIFWANELKWPSVYHRKFWELLYVTQSLWSAGKLVSGARGLGFGCGAESLPSLFAKYGATILATDLPASRPEAEVWSAGGQHASSVEALRKRAICPDEKRLETIEFRPLDMNDIDRDLDGGFDFCWSLCALEHLGSIDKGFDFIRNSLRTLKPGGVAVHTTEFTFDPGPVRDNNPCVLFTKDRLVEFAERLRREGFTVAEFDFSPGDGDLDGFADIPLLPAQTAHIARSRSLLHLKICIDGYVCTSVGLTVTAPGR